MYKNHSTNESRKSVTFLDIITSIVSVMGIAAAVMYWLYFLR